MFTSKNTLFLRRCFDIARLANSAKTSPNPSVGAVIVEADTQRIIGEGFTQPYGGSHGEVMAVGAVKEVDRPFLPFSTMYVSLEPCHHFGKTPPCVNLLLKENISKVIIAHLDPNPLVAGKSLAKLMVNNVNVQVFIPNNAFTRQKKDINENTDWVYCHLENGTAATLLPFFTNIAKKRPYIILKWAESADGFIGKPRETVPISNAFSKRLVHKWRSEVDAIMVGTTTAALDNPELTNRFYYGKSPIRVVLDRHSRLSPTLKLFDGSVRTLVFSENREDTEGVGLELKIKNLELNDNKFSHLANKGSLDINKAMSLKDNTNTIEQRFVDFDDSLLDHILADLQAQNIGILLVEGGEQLLSSFIKRGLWDEARVFTASQTLGDGIRAPQLLAASLQQTVSIESDILRCYKNTVS
jgi:diaminohydroxyphosphoribosylaminopyrimidine deaminase / 5-amino-6-(5-phosphoribosylamino)uracil reductase